MRIPLSLLTFLTLPVLSAAAQVAIDGRSYNGGGYGPVRYGNYSS